MADSWVDYISESRQIPALPIPVRNIGSIKSKLRMPTISRICKAEFNVSDVLRRLKVLVLSRNLS